MFRIVLTLTFICGLASADVGYLAVETGTNRINYTTADSAVWKDNPQFLYFYVKINASAVATDGWIYLHLPTGASVQRIGYTVSGGTWNANRVIPVLKGWLNGAHVYYVDYRYLKERGRWLNGNLMILSFQVNGLQSPYEVMIDYRVNGIIEQWWTYTSLMRVNPFITPIVDAPVRNVITDDDDRDGDGNPNVRTVYAFDVNGDGLYTDADIHRLRALIAINPHRMLKHDFNLDDVLDEKDIEILEDEIERRAVAAAPTLFIKRTTLWANLKRR